MWEVSKHFCLGENMKKNKNFSMENKYTFVDAFKTFFFILIAMTAISFLMQIIISIVSTTTGQTFEAVAGSTTMSIISALMSPVIFIVFYFVFNKYKKTSNRVALSDGQRISLLPISIALVLAIISVFLFTPFVNLIDYGFLSMGYFVSNDIPLQALMSSSFPYFMLGVLIYAVLPAIGEELIFRGIIQKSLSTKLTGFATIMMTTLLFVFIHGSLNQTIYQFLVGIMLSYLVYVGGSVVYSIILHMLNNFLVLLFSCFDIVGYLSAESVVYYNVFSMIFPISIFLLGLILVAILFWVLKYLRNKNFFRYDSRGRKKKVKESDLIDLNAPEKIKMRGIWSNATYAEKVFMLCSFVLIGIIWIINTISGFVG